MYSCPPGTDRETYLEWLLAEELGEVASLFSKAIRDGAVLSTHLGTITVYGPDAVLVHNRHLLEKELGDVMWAAVMKSKQDLDAVAWSDFESAPLDFDQWHAHYMVCTSTEFERACMLAVGFGFDPEWIALANVAKLKSRKARGVVHGAGDNR